MSDSQARDESGEAAADNPWARLAECRDALELCIEEDTPFAERAEFLLALLDEEGY